MADAGRIPGPIVVPNCCQVLLRWTLANGKIFNNVLAGIVDGGFTPSPTIAQAIYAAIIGSSAWTAYKPFVNSAAHLAGVDLRDIRVAHLPLVSSTGGPTAGTGGGNAQPPEVALVVTLRTDHAGQGFRGRVYLGAFDAAAIDTAGTAVSGLVTAAAAFVTEVQSAIGASGMALCLAQPARAAYTGRTGTAHAARAAAAIPVTSIVCRDAVFDSQRRRSR